jgi:hypothetical protein
LDGYSVLARGGRMKGRKDSSRIVIWGQMAGPDAEKRWSSTEGFTVRTQLRRT